MNVKAIKEKISDFTNLRKVKTVLETLTVLCKSGDFFNPGEPTACSVSNAYITIILKQRNQRNIKLKIISKLKMKFC